MTKTINWDELLEDFEDEQAILFIGPELVQLNGKSLGLQVREQLQRENPQDILHHYRRDGIFLFKDETAKVSAQKKIKRLYKQLPPDETLLQRIAALPFHLIISLTPDTHLRDVFEQCGLQTHFDFFGSGERAENLPKPERGKPLIYNLVGHIGHDESLVLDYDDVFNLISDCFIKGLPLKISAQLDRASTFVFLGFDFEKWHTQMLLRFLSKRPGISKFAVEGELPPGKDTQTFLINGFKIRFEKGEHTDETFFDSLYHHCNSRNMLRTLVNQFSGNQVVVMRLVYAGKLTTALDDLLKHLSDQEDRDAAVVQSSKLHNLENEKDKIDRKEYWVEWNKIAFSTIQLAKKLKP